MIWGHSDLQYFWRLNDLLNAFKYSMYQVPVWVFSLLESERTWTALIHRAPWKNTEWFLRLGSKRPSSFHLVCGNTCCWNSALLSSKSDYPKVAMVMRHSGEDTWGGLDVTPRSSSEPQPPASSWLRHQTCKQEILGKPRPHPLKPQPFESFPDSFQAEKCIQAILTTPYPNSWAMKFKHGHWLSLNFGVGVLYSSK